MSKNYTSKPQSTYNYQSYIKFQSIWRALDFVQICPKLYECQHFETLNIKIVIGMQQYTPVSNFSLFEELKILKPNLSKKYQ